MARSSLAALSLALGLCSITAQAASSEEWRSRTVYQVLTDRFARTDGSTTAPCDAGQGSYCGGTFQGIAKHLDYIQGMGFDAIWISPVTAQIQGTTAYGDAYHGYWQQDIYSINPNFGTEDDLKTLASELHDRDMYLMVDVVVNHFGFNGAPESVEYSIFDPFNSSSDFHNYCAIDFADIADTQQLEDCWSGDQIVSLPDLRTEDDNVADVWNSWIHDLVANYSIDGLRLDTAIEVNPSFWAGFEQAAGVYLVGETYNEDVDFVCAFQDVMPGVMDYSAYFPLLTAFTSTPNSNSNAMRDLASTLNDVKSQCADSTLKGTFTENHDRPRIGQVNGDITAAKNAIAYTILADGIPIIYQGQEQHYASIGGSGDPYNREALWLSSYNTDVELYNLTASLNAARKAAIADDGSYLTYKNYPIYTDDTTIAMRKGKMITVLSNKGSDGDAYEQVISAAYEAGTEVTEVLSCATVTVEGDGAINVPMLAGLPRVYYPSAAVSGICDEAGGQKREARWRA